MAQPEKTFRLGSAHASVFLNDSDEGQFRTITVQRRYKDGDNWKSSNSYTGTQAASALVVIQQALAHLLHQESEKNVD
jgi:hypothetical protein